MLSQFLCTLSAATSTNSPKRSPCTNTSLSPACSWPALPASKSTRTRPHLHRPRRPEREGLYRAGATGDQISAHKAPPAPPSPPAAREDLQAYAQPPEGAPSTSRD